VSHVAVVGAGAIGSHVLPLIARLPHVHAITVVDRDTYDASNLAKQDIAGSDVGTSKAEVQARRLRAVSNTLAVRSLHMPIEDVPLGWLRSDVMLACLDSRRARMTVNQIAWRLGIPWINAGLQSDEELVRVQAFIPSPDSACLECAWDARDYDLVEQTYPCRAGHIAATGGSAGLAALAASLQALECEKFLKGDLDSLLSGRDLMIDARNHRHFITRFARNAGCRMPDHDGWSISKMTADPASTTLRQFLSLVDERLGSDAQTTLEVAGQRFAIGVRCSQCASHSPIARVFRGELHRIGSPCDKCGEAAHPTGFDLVDRVRLAELPSHASDLPLASLGLLAGDVVVIRVGEVVRQLELDGAP
jgi:molybdopterin/thiamine biosynthesis adenylyltransferase